MYKCIIKSDKKRKIKKCFPGSARTKKQPPPIGKKETDSRNGTRERKKETSTTEEPAAPVTHPATLDTTHNHAAPAKMDTRSTDGEPPTQHRRTDTHHAHSAKDGNRQTDQPPPPRRTTRTTEHKTPPTKEGYKTAWKKLPRNLNDGQTRKRKKDIYYI